MSDYEFTHLAVADRIAAINERIRAYEGKLYDTMMNQKAEALSSNPNKHRAVAELQKDIKDLTSSIEMCRFELSMLEEVENLDTDGRKSPAETT